MKGIEKGLLSEKKEEQIPENFDRPVAIEGQFFGRERGKFSLFEYSEKGQEAGAAMLGSDYSSEIYLETKSGNMYKIYKVPGRFALKEQFNPQTPQISFEKSKEHGMRGKWVLMDALANQGKQPKEMEGAILSDKDLEKGVLHTGQPFNYGKDKRTETITKITGVIAHKIYRPDYLKEITGGVSSDVRQEFAERIMSQKKKEEIGEPIETEQIVLGSVEKLTTPLGPVEELTDKVEEPEKRPGEESKESEKEKAEAKPEQETRGEAKQEKSETDEEKIKAGSKVLWETEKGMLMWRESKEVIKISEDPKTREKYAFFEGLKTGVPLKELTLAKDSEKKIKQDLKTLFKTVDESEKDWEFFQKRIEELKKQTDDYRWFDRPRGELQWLLPPIYLGRLLYRFIRKQFAPQEIKNKMIELKSTKILEMNAKMKSNENKVELISGLTNDLFDSPSGLWDTSRILDKKKKELPKELVLDLKQIWEFYKNPQNYKTNFIKHFFENLKKVADWKKLKEDLK